MTNFMATDMGVTDKAAKEIKRLNPDSPLRVQVVGGGCSGMSYKLDFDNAQPNDKKFEINGVTLLIDPKSYLYLEGTELDFSDGLNGTGFTFNNPKASRSCGCGSSFSV